MWRTILGSFCAVIVVFAVSPNAVYMFISPQAWFRLSGWIRLNGTLTQSRYGSGWGAVQVRLSGAIMLTVLAWFAHHVLSR
jgi:hypothetical protein